MLDPCELNLKQCLKSNDITVKKKRNTSVSNQNQMSYLELVQFVIKTDDELVPRVQERSRSQARTIIR